MSLADQVFLCEIFGSARENHGKLSIEDLQEKIAGAKVIHEKTCYLNSEFENSVILFMGAGDVHKYQDAYENFLNEGVK